MDTYQLIHQLNNTELHYNKKSGTKQAYIQLSKDILNNLKFIPTGDNEYLCLKNGKKYILSRSTTPNGEERITGNKLNELFAEMGLVAGDSIILQKKDEELYVSFHKRSNYNRFEYIPSEKSWKCWDDENAFHIVNNSMPGYLADREVQVLITYGGQAKIGNTTNPTQLYKIRVDNVPFVSPTNIGVALIDGFLYIMAEHRNIINKLAF